MKKLLSVILVVTMLFAVMAPAASAAEVVPTVGKTPIIYIRGNGEQLYEADGVTPIVATFEDLNLGGDDAEGAEGTDDTALSGIDKDVIVETAVNILKPFVLEGMMFDEWDNYGKVLYEEIAPLFKDAGLDHNGNPLNGTRVGKKELAKSEEMTKHKWYFNVNEAYTFCYDWRLSPYDHVERLHTYVKAVMKAAGTTQVSFYARCLGGSLLSAYIDEYGHEGHIKNVMFSDVLSNEATFISKAFSGQVEFDATLVERYTGQLDYCGKYGYGVGFEFSELLYEIVFETMSFFNQIGATDAALDGVETLYAKLYKALVPALCHAIGFATQVNHWTCVAEEDMDAALDLMFGVKGTETREMYAGLIAKIQKYRTNISSDLVGFYDKATKTNGIHIGFLGKYGYLNAPLTVGADLHSDGLVSLEDATMGATCAKIGKTLSDDYIADRVAEGKGKYIAPDKMVDLSTCYSPDTTWIFKNAHHNIDRQTNPVIYAFLNGDKVTVDSLKASHGYNQFNVYDDVAGTFSPMSEDDGELPFMTIAVDEPSTESIFVAALRWFTMLFKVIGMLLRGELSFSEAKEIL